MNILVYLQIFKLYSPVTKVYIKVVRVVFLSTNLLNLCHSIPLFLLRKAANACFLKVDFEEGVVK